MRILITIFCFLLVSGLTAGETEGKFSLGVKIGTETYWGDIDDQQYKSLIGGSIYYWLSNSWAIGLNAEAGYLKADNTPKGEARRYFKTELFNYNLMARFSPWENEVFKPYLTAGLEMFYINPMNVNGNFLPNRQAGKYDKNQFAIPAGLGFSIFAGDDFSFDFEAVHHFATADWIDDLDRGSKNDGFTTLTVGVSYYLGAPKDTDKDGIFDKVDADPLHAEDFDGFEDSDGAPDYDNDKDGVLDVNDKAPNDPEDQDGFEDNDGVPDVDNDKDGILDVNDKAPNKAEDMDGFEDEDGAPDLDNDQDGILDEDDKCPNKAETMNGYEDADGCPDKKPEIAVEKGAAIVLEGINFASGKSILTGSSKEILGKVLRTLAENKGIEVEIRGYTDNTGRYESNVRLSQSRADAVKAFLVKNGIADSRIQTHGFGPEKPIAPNDTREGRAKNRRIEFYRIK
jgi:outer membrane protein OmpA-like peptidoglycan-associated protein